MNLRKRTVLTICICAAYLVFVCVSGTLLKEAAMTADFDIANEPPSLAHPFGTDWLGRDMLVRTLAGLSLSVWIGLVSAAASACIALVLGTCAASLGKKADTVVSFLIDVVMGIPHILLLILISFALGKGFVGLVTALALTHWTSLARVIRGEALQLKGSLYVQTSLRLGHGALCVARRHMLPHILPQFITGMILTFPHAILHEASITFLGFGLSSEQPAIGIILSESLQYLIVGRWWLAVFPGAMLVLTVFLFYRAGKAVRRMLDPKGARE